MRQIATVLCLACLSACSTQPDTFTPLVRPADQARLARFDNSFAKALETAASQYSNTDFRILDIALEGVADPSLDPSGTWSCRIVKIGGLLPLTAYAPFVCVIEQIEPNLWTIEKITGSQRFKGTLQYGGKRVLYRGVGFVNGGPAGDYATLPPHDQTPVEPGQTVAQVGYFEHVTKNRARLMLPSPIFESDFDVVYLER